MFAPYIDMSLSDNNLPTISSASGIKDFTMAFIVSDNGQAEWGGVGLVSTETTMLPLINALRAEGGNVIISFGGASGSELADTSGISLSSLEAQYQAVINKYGATALDFDIEGGAGSNTTGINLRNEALAALQSANPGLVVSYTLPVLPTGLVQDGLNVLSNAKSNGVNVSVVNVMAMDYGSSFTGDMGTYAIDAANATISQVQSIGLSAKVGIIPMIGQNDTSVETFTLADAQALETYAQGNSSIGRMSFWSVARDQSCADDADTLSPDCSGITQNPWDFSHVFEAFGGGGGTTTVATPTFSPAGGTYSSTQSVSINDSTSGATIYYTTNGSTPTTSSTVYSSPISVSSTKTIEVLGVKSGDNNSSVASATYTISVGEGPFGGTPAAIPGTVQAENYDTGGQGVAYNVTSINGTDNGYRSDGVDLEVCSDTGGGVDVGWESPGQWFKYTVNVATAGTYTVSFRIAAPNAVTDAFHLSNSSGTNLSGNVNLPATGGYQTWATVTANVTLPAGQQTLTLNQDTGGGVWNINYMTFATSGGGTTVATPTFSPAGGTYTSTQTVTLSDSTSGATIYYTTNGSTPTTSSTVYSGAISVSSGTVTIEAIGVKSGDTTSSVASATYTISSGGGGNEPAPTFSEPTGTYSSEVHTRIKDTDANASIYYTTDGSTPTSSSTPNPDSTIEFKTTTTLKAIAIDNGVSSPVTTAVYTID